MPDHPIALHEAFLAAELARDAAALDGLLAEDFRSIGEQGYVLGKAAWLGKFADFRYLAVTASEVDVAEYPGAAVIRSVHRSRSIWQGTEMSLTTRLGETWVRLPEGWRLAALQFSSYSPG